MKNLKYLLACFCILFLSSCTNEQKVGLANPWTDCLQDMNCAKKIAGFNFPLKLSNYTIRAMQDMIEITYPLDETRYVTIRKSQKYSGNGDTSGDYNNYPVSKKIFINDVPFYIRGDNDIDKIYVMNFSASKGYYSARCENGMTVDEIKGIYEIIRKADESK